jgi:tRNA nucleotidyltransferase (CCA-adding enzyme)
LPVVEPDGLEEDLRRRDFSINALAASLHPDRFGRVVDPFSSLADLETGLLRGLHADTFRDDATRILRGARYAARLGFQLEQEMEGWLRRDAHYLKTISPDRLRHEMERIFQEERADIALDLLADWGALKHLGPSLKWSRELSEAFRQVRSGIPPDVPPRTVQWALLAWPLGRDGGEALARAFNLSAAELRAIRDLFRWRRPFGNGGVFRDTLAEASPRGVVERLEGYDLSSLTALSLIEDERHVGERLRRYLSEWRHVRPVLSGDDLLALGVPQGPRVGAYLKRLRLARLDREATTADDERGLVRRWMEEES